MPGSWKTSRWDRPQDYGWDESRSFFRRFSSLTELLIWANIAVFVTQILAGRFWPGYPDWILGLSTDGLRHFFLWQPVTYMFCHVNVFHILINLLILWFIGREVEFFIGTRSYARLYLVGGLAGAALWFAFNYDTQGLLMGASAAVLACVIAYATLFPAREITLLVFFVLPVRIKAKYLALILIALDVIPLLQHAASGVAHLAHLGGAAFGYIYIKHLGYGPTPRWLMLLPALFTRPRRRDSRAAAPPHSRRPSSRAMSTDDFIREQVDPILDKISRDGINSLTPQEREILEKAREIMDQKPR